MTTGCVHRSTLHRYKVMLDSNNEPSRRMKLPLTIKGNRGRARNEPIEPKSAEVSEGELDCSILDSQDEKLVL